MHRSEENPRTPFFFSLLRPRSRFTILIISSHPPISSLFSSRSVAALSDYLEVTTKLMCSLLLPVLLQALSGVTLHRCSIGHSTKEGSFHIFLFEKDISIQVLMLKCSGFRFDFRVFIYCSAFFVMVYCISMARSVQSTRDSTPGSDHVAEIHMV